MDIKVERRRHTIDVQKLSSRCRDEYAKYCVGLLYIPCRRLVEEAVTLRQSFNWFSVESCFDAKGRK